VPRGGALFGHVLADIYEKESLTIIFVTHDFNILPRPMRRTVFMNHLLSHSLNATSSFASTQGSIFWGFRHNFTKPPLPPISSQGDLLGNQYKY